jgi:hypothetical protein
MLSSLSVHGQMRCSTFKKVSQDHCRFRARERSRCRGHSRSNDRMRDHAAGSSASSMRSRPFPRCSSRIFWRAPSELKKTLSIKCSIRARSAWHGRFFCWPLWRQLSLIALHPNGCGHGINGDQDEADIDVQYSSEPHHDGIASRTPLATARCWRPCYGASSGCGGGKKRLSVAPRRSPMQASTIRPGAHGGYHHADPISLGGAN